jgi:3-oxoacyl-[acyl-carrier protein] reductase
VRLEGKVTIVTGGGSGMGAAIAQLFSAEGANVIVADIDGKAATSVAKDLRNTTAMALDITDSGAVNEAFRTVCADAGRLDVLVHAAGRDDLELKRRFAAANPAEPILVTSTMTDDQWHQQIAVNLDGTFYVVRAALREMLPKCSGSIVTISSIGGLAGAPFPHYGAAKGGVLSFTRSVAQEVWKSGVRVNSIAPGHIDTPMLSRNPLAQAPPAISGRFGQPSEIASVALFLATEDSSFITGETIIVSGPVLTI